MALEDLLNNELIQQVLFAMLFTYTSSVCLFFLIYVRFSHCGEILVFLSSI